MACFTIKAVTRIEKILHKAEAYRSCNCTYRNFASDHRQRKRHFCITGFTFGNIFDNNQ